MCRQILTARVTHHVWAMHGMKVLCLSIFFLYYSVRAHLGNLQGEHAFGERQLLVHLDFPPVLVPRSHRLFFNVSHLWRAKGKPGETPAPVPRLLKIDAPLTYNDCLMARL